MGRQRPGAWLGLGLLFVLAFGVIYFVGVSAGGKDVDESCAAVGQSFDREYRERHWQEPSRLFPLHNRCNADHDLVPPWVNPALVALVVATAVCLIGCIVSVTTLSMRRMR